MNESPRLQPHFGLLQATALNVTLIVGAGVFVTIPYMLRELPGPYAVLGWVAGAVLMLLDGLIWSELGAALPGSGGTYTYLLESYGRDRWGRPAAFLFIWQFLISGPLELASGLIAIAGFSNALDAGYAQWNASHRIEAHLAVTDQINLGLILDPSRLLAIGLGLLVIALLYRRIATLGKLTVTLWIGVLAVIAWVLIEGAAAGNLRQILDFSAISAPESLWRKMGAATLLAMYSYLGYYNVCYIGDEVRNPGRTIPRAIILSALLVGTLFVAVHLSLLSVVPWQSVPATDEGLRDYSLVAAFMTHRHGDWAATLATVLLIWCCFGSVFAGMLGYARIPYGAATQGHFFSIMGRVHPQRRIPHISLLFVGAMTVAWSLFDLESVIKALVVTRILEQFVAQIFGVMRLRRTRPDLPRPYRIWLYPVPCILALAGWIWLYVAAEIEFIAFGLIALGLGVAAFLVWARRTRGWPFPPRAG